MAKTRTTYVCQQCGYSQVGWAGKCPNCGAWGSLVETLTKDTKESSKDIKSVNLIGLSTITSKKLQRTSTGISEFDRALGGGVVTGQVSLIAGEPGIGKSTLLLQVAEHLGSSFYISGEESMNQIKIRADRLGIPGKKLFLLEETNIDVILSSIQSKIDENIKPSVIILDSIQTMSTQDLSGMAGSVGQVRECTYRIVRFAKKNHIPTFIVGHVTKEGTVAGPSVLAHLVDTVLWFEGDKSLALRMVRAIKNRFGPTDEVGIFQMEEKGLISVSDTSKLFVSSLKSNASGSVTTIVMEGSRPMPVEIQSLIVTSKLAIPRRVAQGIDAKRLEVILAVILKYGKVPVNDNDVFVNVVGGISVKEPAVDLAILASIVSSYFDTPLDSGSIILGEVGLLGEIRSVFQEERRKMEAKRLGYKKVINSLSYAQVTHFLKANFNK